MDRDQSQLSQGDCILVSAMEKLSPIAPPVPELPVADVEQARQYYCDKLGFKVGWLMEGKEMGAVSRGEATIFLRKRVPPFEPVTHWIFAADLDATWQEMQSSGAIIADPLERKPWGLRQFTVGDLDGNLFHFHHD